MATIKPMANPIEVSRRCAVTPSGTPMIANAMHANGNENRLLISVRLALRSRLSSLFNCSSNCSIDSADRLGRFFSLLVQFVETDGESPLHHIDSVAYLSQVGRVLGIALLVTRLVQVHENLLVRQIGFEHARARVRHFYRQRVLVQFEDSDVLELVTFFLSNVNFAPGKLIDHLIAAKKCHRIARSEIEYRASQFFLCCRCNLNVKPETDHSARYCDTPKRNAHAGNAHTVRAERDQLISAESRPNTSRIAVNNPQGIVKISENGNT